MAGPGLLPHGDLALDDAGPVPVQFDQDVVGVEDLGPAGVGLDDAGVAHLAAGLGVEGRAVEHDAELAVVALGHHGEHRGRGLVLLTAHEPGRPVGLEHLLVAGDVGRPPGLLLGLLGPAALLGHLGVEAGLVDRHARLAHDLLGDLEGEAVGVVEQEGHLAGQGLALAQLGQLRVEDGRAGAQGLAEPALLALDGLAHDLVALGQLGVVGGHDRHHLVDQVGGDHLVDAQQVGVAHGPADDAPQDVAPLLVGRDDAVVDQEGHGAGVLGQDAQRHVGALLGAIGHPGELAGPGDEAAELVGVEDRVDALEHGQDALEAGTGVDRGLG